MCFKSILKESSSMRFYARNENELFFVSRLNSKFLIFIVFALLLNFALLLLYPFLKLEIDLAICEVGIILFSLIGGISYKKSFHFIKEQNKVLIKTGMLWLIRKIELNFGDIQNINIRVEKKPIAGLQIPIPVEKYRLELVLKNGKKRFIDRATDNNLIKKYAEVIASVTSSKVIFLNS